MKTFREELKGPGIYLQSLIYVSLCIGLFQPLLSLQTGLV